MLYRLAHNCKPEQVKEHFGIGYGTVYKYTRLVCKAINTKLKPKHITLPRSSEDVLRAMQEFERLSTLPCIVGAIDGSHIRLAAKPQKKWGPADYWCRHDCYSIVLQGLVNAQGRFIDIAVWSPGRNHDSTVLRGSSLWHRMCRKEVLSQPVQSISCLLYTSDAADD